MEPRGWNLTCLFSSRKPDRLRHTCTPKKTYLATRKEAVDVLDHLSHDTMKVLLQAFSLSVLLSLCWSQATKCPVKNCCSMTEDELTACRGEHAKCPGGAWFGSIDRRSCDECPYGSCRGPEKSGTIDSCYCPEYFMSSFLARSKCATSHGTLAWPVSAGKAEIDRKRCVGVKKYLTSGKPAAAVPPIAAAVLAKCPVKDCCSMTEEEITACRGIYKKCPGESWFGAIDRTSCDECPQGSCRGPETSGTSDSCYCPEYFISSFSARSKCATSHGTLAWPDSAGKTEIDRRKRCKGVENGVDGKALTGKEQRTGSAPTTATGTSSSSDSTTAGSRSGESPSAGSNTSSTTGGSGSADQNTDGKKLSTGEMVGIGAGVVSALAAVAAVAVAVWKKEDIANKWNESPFGAKV